MAVTAEMLLQVIIGPREREREKVMVVRGVMVRFKGAHHQPPATEREEKEGD